MPYIQPDQRKLIDKTILTLAKKIVDNTTAENLGGVANYTITKLILRILCPKTGWNYESLSRVIGTLECSKQEILRRLVGPYENVKIQENGDLVELSEVDYKDPKQIEIKDLRMDLDGLNESMEDLEYPT
jgi:hypothetical protein